MPERVGTWDVVDARRRDDGRLVLELEIDPPAPGLAVEPGPAMVFATLGAYGDLGGDVAWSYRFGRPTQAAARPCPDDADCALHARLVLPTHRMGAVLEQAPNDLVGGIGVHLTLVRTFDQGAWTQVLPLEKRVAEGGDPGTLGDPQPFHGWLHNHGSFSAAQAQRWLDALPEKQRGYPTLALTEQHRLRADDPSEAAASATVSVDVDAGACQGWTLATESGDIAYDIAEPVSGRQALTVDLPVGSAWHLLSPSVSVLDSHLEATWFGPFTVEPDGLALEGAWDCSEEAWIVSGGDVSAVPRPS